LKAAGVTYSPSDWLAVTVRLVMTDGMLKFHDVDNRLKDILDALQARVGGPKKVRRLPPLIPNDYQVLKANVEKVRGKESGGLLTIECVGGPGLGAV
jgi:hypothetical protein